MAANDPVYLPTTSGRPNELFHDDHAQLRGWPVALRHHHYATAGLILALLLGACSATSPEEPTAAHSGSTADVGSGPSSGHSMCTRAEVSHPYPNSLEYARTPQDGTLTTEASCTVRFISDDDQTRIYDYYAKWLRDQGYHYFSDVSLDSDASARNFQTADCRRSVSLAVKNLEVLRIRNDPSPTTGTTKTVFEITDLERSAPICYPEKPIPPVPATTTSRVP